MTSQAVTMSTAEAAAELGVSTTTITRMLQPGGPLRGYKKNPTKINSPYRVYSDSVRRLKAMRGGEVTAQDAGGFVALPDVDPPTEGDTT